jgi:hypothetical protein
LVGSPASAAHLAELLDDLCRATGQGAGALLRKQIPARGVEIRRQAIEQVIDDQQKMIYSLKE